MCPSSGELIVSIRHLVYVTLYRWLFGVQVWMRGSLIQTYTPYGNLHRVTYTRCRIDKINSPDDGHMAAPKHVENRNKRIWKRTVRQVGYLQRLYRDSRSTEHKVAALISIFPIYHSLKILLCDSNLRYWLHVVCLDDAARR